MTKFERNLAKLEGKIENSYCTADERAQYISYVRVLEDLLTEHVPDWLDRVIDEIGND